MTTAKLFLGTAGMVRGLESKRAGLSRVRRNNLLLLTLSHPNNLSLEPRGSFSLIWIPAVFFITDRASISVKHIHRLRVCVCAAAAWGFLTTSFNPYKNVRSLQTHRTGLHGGIAPRIEPGISIHFQSPSCLSRVG